MSDTNTNLPAVSVKRRSTDDVILDALNKQLGSVNTKLEAKTEQSQNLLTEIGDLTERKLGLEARLAAFTAVAAPVAAPVEVAAQ